MRSSAACHNAESSHRYAHAHRRMAVLTLIRTENTHAQRQPGSFESTFLDLASGSV